jgi:hypothetical protein
MHYQSPSVYFTFQATLSYDPQLEMQVSNGISAQIIIFDSQPGSPFGRNS